VFLFQVSTAINEGLRKIPASISNGQLLARLFLVVTPPETNAQAAFFG